MSSNQINGAALSRRSLAVAIGMALTAGAAQAGTISVTTTDDIGTGSFREAIQTANGNLGADIIDFSAVSGQTITLTGNLPVIGDDLTLQGSDVTLNGDGQHSCLAAEFSNLTVDNLTITGCVGSDLGGQRERGALAYGGGILIDNGDLTVTGSTISNNGPAGAAPKRGLGGNGLSGGGIWAAGGSVTISDSVISGNTAEEGGGILHYGFGRFRGEQPAGDPTPSNLTISRSVISDNVAKYAGGGVMSLSTDANVEIDETEIVGNQAGDAGGGLFMFGDGTAMTLSNSTISGNSAVGGGAGAALMLNKYPGNIELSNNTISGNAADFLGGLYLSVDSFQSRDATPSGIQPPVQLVGQTITGNTALYGSGGGLTAVFNQPTAVVIGNSIIAGNSAATGSGDLSASTPQQTLDSEWGQRLAERIGREHRGSGAPGNTTFQTGFSIVGAAPDDGSTFSPDTVSADLLGEDPELGGLADNGGPTSTHLPAATSPALNIVTAAGGCGEGFNLDQRGEPRPEVSGTLCDAGSVERGAPPLIDANPDIAFGTVDVGDSAGPEAVTLANNGGMQLDVTAFNGVAAPFTLDFSDCAAGLPFSLAAGESCSLLADFSPASAGAFAQTVTVESNSGGGDDSFELSGTGVVPAIAANPLGFGGVPVGQSVPGTVTIENTGQGSLDVSGLSLSNTAGGVFALGTDTCGAPIAAGGSCNVTIDFTPSTAGAFNGSLAVESNATAEPLEVALSGEGLIGNLVITPAGGLNFGDVPVGESGQADLTLGNDGDAPVQVNGWPDPAAPFSIVGGSCPTAPFTLAPGETCTLTFGFAPTDQGDYGETLDFSVSNGSGGASVPVSVSGRGTALGLPIPTLDRIGLIIGGGLLALMGLLGLRRRQGSGPV